MKLALFDETAFHQDHPKGTVSFNYLLMGDEPDSLENYRYILGRQEADFHMPRHRHTFEQIRATWRRNLPRPRMGDGTVRAAVERRPA
jgi:hypothetical protein